MTLDQLLSQLGQGRRIGVRTRQGGGLGDATSPMSADVKAGIFPGSVAPSSGEAAPAIEESFDESKMLPFISSNVDGGYFIRYDQEEEAFQSGSVSRGDLYLKFQKRRPEKPGGRPIGPSRAYVYQNVSEAIWLALLGAASPGGTVWDVIRHGGIPGDPI